MTPHPNDQVELYCNVIQFKIRKILSGPPDVVCPYDQYVLGNFREVTSGGPLGREVFPEFTNMVELSTGGSVIGVHSLMEVREQLFQVVDEGGIITHSTPCPMAHLGSTPIR